jgi:nicotinate phosphoribosyltransferase
MAPLFEPANRPAERASPLPESHTPYIDKYFLRSKEILAAKELNPFVRAQVVIRDSAGEIAGVSEAIEILKRYSNLATNGGRVFGLRDGEHYEKNKALLVIEARIQDIVDLETMYLGVIAAETTKRNDGVDRIDYAAVTEKVRSIKEQVGDRTITYFGARHWRYDEDAAIAQGAFAGGATEASTDIAARLIGKKGVGTIPHVLENIFAWRYGREEAVPAATKAFDDVIDRSVPRVALIDYDNHEVDDVLETARRLNGRLHTARLDTCGENVAQGGFRSASDVPLHHPLHAVLGSIPEQDLKYWFGYGVTVSATFAVRRALDQAGYSAVNIMLTSGFADEAKVAAFVRAEKLLNMRLFDSLGIGGLYKPCRSTKMDVVAVSVDRAGLDSSPIAKAGRSYQPNSNLSLLLGE